MTDRQQQQRRHAGIYVRISKWESEGESGGARRQGDDCRAEAKRQGWSVAEPIYRDDDFSAFSGEARPSYDRLCADLKAGAINAVLVWHTDRLHRSLIELEQFIPLIEATGAPVVSVTGGDYDLSTDDGRFKARIMAAVARKESEDKSRRLRRKHEALRAEGVPNGGNRPYGYRAGVKPDPETGKDVRTWLPDPDEAPIVAEVIVRLAQGETLTRVADDLNARGIPTAKSAKAWTLPNLRRMATNPIYIGRRTYEGKDVGPGNWGGIVDEANWRRSEALLADHTDKVRQARDRRDAGYLGAGPSRSARRYLLSGGLAVCGKCGTPLRSKPQHDRRTGLVATYACPTTKQGGCGGVSMRAAALERLVAETIIGHVESPHFAKDLRQRKGNDPRAVADVRDIEVRKDKLSEAYQAGAIDIRFLAKTMAGLDARLVEAQSRIATDTTTAAVGRYAGRKGALAAFWADEATTLDQQRAILRAVGTTAVVAPVGKGGKRGFDPGRVKIRWEI